MVSPGTHPLKIMSPCPEPLNPSSKTRVPGSLCNQLVNLRQTPKLCIAVYWKKKYSFYRPAQQRLKEICAVKQQAQEQPQKSHKQNILQKTSSGRSVCLCVFGDFYASGTQDAEVTKSLLKCLRINLSPKIMVQFFFILDSIQKLNCFVSSERKDGHGLKLLQVSIRWYASKNHGWRSLMKFV